MDEMQDREQPPQAQEPGRPPASAEGFDFNRPTIISLLYLVSFLGIGVTSIIGVVLGYIWKGEPHEAWETSHYQYLIRTFWIGLLGGIVSALLIVALIGMVLLPAVFLWIIVRCVKSTLAAQKREPMPDPETWWV
jgi:uncharacterized membrane protein